MGLAVSIIEITLLAKPLNTHTQITYQIAAPNDLQHHWIFKHVNKQTDVEQPGEHKLNWSITIPEGETTTRKIMMRMIVMSWCNEAEEGELADTVSA